MHHFLYPTQDSYISSNTSEANGNFGIDEQLCIGVDSTVEKIVYSSRSYSFNNDYMVLLKLENFSGSVTGSLVGKTPSSNGKINYTSAKFSSSYFSGSVTNCDLIGYETGSSVSYTNYFGNLIAFSGSLNSRYDILGDITGSLIANDVHGYTGRLISCSGSFTGYITGTEIRGEQYTQIESSYDTKRTLIKFDLASISQSIIAGDISNPKFYLKLKSSEATDLPTTYTVYINPISQSWAQGDGYWSDNSGSYTGVSWNYRDYYGGTPWSSSGGGTWYNTTCSQSFTYQSSDINADVTTIINGWLSGSYPNEGFILRFSSENELTASNPSIFFYSKETNTIFMPRLDIGWDDSVWITGSFGTGSVVISYYNSGVSGSIISGTVVTGKDVSGSVSGNAYLVLTSDNQITTGSLFSLVGMTGTIDDLVIEGGTLGTSSLETSGSRYITASFSSGDFLSSTVYGTYSSSMFTGFITGSFSDRLFVSHSITGSIDSIKTTIYLYQPMQETFIGGTSGSQNGGTFSGVAINGLLKGGTITIPFTGSYSYLTSSMILTSSVEITSSVISPLNTEKPFVVVIQDLKNTYSFGDLPRINVFAREKFPLKTFTKSHQQTTYTTPKLLPSSSFYSIKDNETEEIIIDFDNYTKISCDLNGHYFNLNTTGLEEERYYKILVRVQCIDGDNYTFDSHDLFKIRR